MSVWNSTTVCEPFGPLYPQLGATVAKYRRKTSKADTKAYGNAVLEAIRSKQAGEIRRLAPSMPKPNTASGTYLSDGNDILKHVANAQRAALLSCH